METSILDGVIAQTRLSVPRQFVPDILGVLQLNNALV